VITPPIYHVSIHVPLNMVSHGFYCVRKKKKNTCKSELWAAKCFSSNLMFSCSDTQ